MLFQRHGANLADRGRVSNYPPPRQTNHGVGTEGAENSEMLRRIMGTRHSISKSSSKTPTFPPIATISSPLLLEGHKSCRGAVGRLRFAVQLRRNGVHQKGQQSTVKIKGKEEGYCIGGSKGEKGILLTDPSCCQERRQDRLGQDEDRHQNQIQYQDQHDGAFHRSKREESKNVDVIKIIAPSPQPESFVVPSFSSSQRRSSLSSYLHYMPPSTTVASFKYPLPSAPPLESQRRRFSYGDIGKVKKKEMNIRVDKKNDKKCKDRNAKTNEKEENKEKDKCSAMNDRKEKENESLSLFLEVERCIDLRPTRLRRDVGGRRSWQGLWECIDNILSKFKKIYRCWVGKDAGLCPFVVVRMLDGDEGEDESEYEYEGEEVLRTPALRSTNNPVWRDECFEIPLPLSMMYLLDSDTGASPVSCNDHSFCSGHCHRCYNCRPAPSHSFMGRLEFSVWNVIGVEGIVGDPIGRAVVCLSELFPFKGRKVDECCDSGTAMVKMPLNTIVGTATSGASVVKEHDAIIMTRNITDDDGKSDDYDSCSDKKDIEVVNVERGKELMNGDSDSVDDNGWGPLHEYECNLWRWHHEHSPNTIYPNGEVRNHYHQATSDSISESNVCRSGDDVTETTRYENYDRDVGGRYDDAVVMKLPPCRNAAIMLEKFKVLNPHPFRRRDIQEGMGREVIDNGDKDDNYLRSTSFKALSLIFIYLALGVVGFSYVFERWSVRDSLYFSVTTFTTVGYGDMKPKSNGGKLFSCLFALIGIGIIGIALGFIGQNLVHAQVMALQRAQRKEYNKKDRKPPVYDKSKNEDQDRIGDIDNVYNNQNVNFVLHYELLRNVAIFICPIVAMTLLGSIVVGINENWTWVDAIYWCIITGTSARIFFYLDILNETVGYGDYVPITNGMIWFSIFFIPLSVGVISAALGRIANIFVEREITKANTKLLTQEVTLEDLETMNADGDGEVSPLEFVEYMLKTMNKVDQSLLDELHLQFEKLDADGSGGLQQDDLVLITQRKLEERRNRALECYFNELLEPKDPSVIPRVSAL